MQKLCDCSQPAQFSLVAIVSSVGVSERLQKCSPAVLLCDDCLLKLSERLHSDALHKAVNAAYTTLIKRLRERSTSKVSIDE